MPFAAMSCSFLQFAAISLTLLKSLFFFCFAILLVFFLRSSLLFQGFEAGSRSGGTCERTLVPVFVLGEHPNVPSFRFSFRGKSAKTTLLENPPFVNPRLLFSLTPREVFPPKYRKTLYNPPPPRHWRRTLGQYLGARKGGLVNLAPGIH